ncbi:Tm-1-like ATP-binding domain-containing protein [Rhodophyticola sp. CCM32]|uniref:Tm-1-like ATP-binding domain-containing protein n=1 Tax=Rhodophyticola sp. CCM32 TaxID=2916397 RepID=UPI00143DA4B9|nr:Tm-1-like ATP-binding domain-containing protein [Rhodophyticola sp. CCM32]
MSCKVTLLSTLETKADEIAFLREALARLGVTCVLVDLSLDTKGQLLDGARKIATMEQVVTRAQSQTEAQLAAGAQAVIGLGGGTGSEIILRVMRALPITFPKLLVTTLPFDPRIAVADNSVILLPTLADICGLNTTLRQVLDTAAAMIAGVCSAPPSSMELNTDPSIGITALGATDGAVDRLVQGLRARGREATVFHANGYGGAAFARFAEQGAFHTIVDLTPHELTRMRVAGAHTAMPTRFTAAAQKGLPQIVLPGALNFIGLGAIDLVPERFLNRPHYQHSGYFTHVKLTEDEMTGVATALVGHLNAAPDLAHLVVPMGGFSHQDAPGGAIEDEDLRAVFLRAARAAADPALNITVMEAHIAAPAVTDLILELLSRPPYARKETQHA